MPGRRLKSLIFALFCPFFSTFSKILMSEWLSNGCHFGIKKLSMPTGLSCFEINGFITAFFRASGEDREKENRDGKACAGHT
jgi:hypothetical protein